MVWLSDGRFLDEEDSELRRVTSKAVEIQESWGLEVYKFKRLKNSGTVQSKDLGSVVGKQQQNTEENDKK